MKVFLTNPPWIVDGRAGVRAGSRWPHLKIEDEHDYLPFPFFLAYAAAVLERAGHEVKLCDAIAEKHSLAQFFDQIKAFGADLLVIETSTPTLDYDLALITRIRQFFHHDLILAGPEGNVYQPAFLADHPQVTFVLVGEYEETLLDLVRHREAGTAPQNVAGLIFRDRNGRVVANPRRPLINNLDQMPWPLRDQLPMTKYEDRPGGIAAPSVQMLASRGCPYRCDFCVWPQLMYGGNTYRARSAKDVVDEMQYLVQKGFKSVYFDDDTFNIGHRRMLAFCRELKQRNLGIPFAVMARADTMDREVLVEMKAAGLQAVKYGVESGVQSLVDHINKDLDLAKVEEIVALTKSLGIFTHLSFTFGLPGETQATIQKTIDFARQLDPDSIQFSITTPFPGTAYYDTLRAKNHIVSDQWSDFDGNYRSVIRTEELSPVDLIEARRTAYSQWHAHKASQFVHDNLDLVGILDGQWAYQGPYHAQIDLTDRCNNNCIACWCHSPLLGELKIRDPQTLNFNVVTELLDELADMGTGEIYLAGGGEPFLHPQIMEVVQQIKDRGMTCHINTNFTRVTKDTAQALIDMGIDHLIVSLWAASAQTYARLHPNKSAATFHQIKDVLGYLIDAKTSRPYVKIYNVIFNQNYHEFDEMIDLALELGADTAEFTVVDTIPGKTDRLLLSTEERNFVLNRIGALKQRIAYDYEPHDGNYIFRFAEKKTLSLFKFEYFIRRLLNADYKIGEYDSDIVRQIPCYIGWNSTRILANGNVNVCLKAHKIPVGNINYQRFRQIWNGPKQREFRRKALRVAKNDPLFSQIGNHPQARIGCFKGCDDITRNVNCHQKLQTLGPHQREILQQAAQRMRLTPC